MAQKILEVSVKEITPRCLTEQAGRNLYEKLIPYLRDGDVIMLDFSGITMFASLFFNNSLGAFLRDFDTQYVTNHVKITNMNETGRKTLKRSMDNAAIFFSLDQDTQSAIVEIVNNNSKKI